MLIVLDNARDSAQVAPLLPGTPSCEVVVTSRAQLTGLATSYGGHLLRVGALSRAAARDLLAGRLGPVRLAAEPGAVDHLLDHCAGLPLALSVVASRAAGRPELRLSELVDELRADAHPREEPDLTRLIARTGALAYLRREPPGYAVDLTAAGRTAPADGHRTADLIGQAHAHHAIARVSGKLNRLDDALYHLHQALDLFDVLGDRVGQARTHHGIGWIFQLRGDNDRFRVHAELSRALFAGTDDRVGLAGVLNSVGWAMAMTGDPRAALVHCEQALAAYQERGDRDGQVDSWDCLGFVHHTLGDYLEAVSCYLEALSVCRTIGDLHREADIMSNLAIIHATAGDHGAAERNASRSTAILDQLGVPGDDHVRAKLASAPVPVDPSSRWCTPR
jgi:tetratricopeptide (TPR) repeat protein